jgi:hypothetical protein
VLDFEGEVLKEEDELTEWMEATSATASASGIDSELAVSEGTVGAASSASWTFASSEVFPAEGRRPADLKKLNIVKYSRCKERR